jgi:hypothetical protein
MKPITHWVAQYLLAAVTLFALLAGVDIARGTPFADAWASAAAWAALAAAIFIGSRYHRARQGAECAICEQVERK